MKRISEGVKTLVIIILLAAILYVATPVSSLVYYYKVCEWMASYHPFIYIPLHTCIYEVNAPNDWQVVTWLDAVPVGNEYRP